MYGKAKETEPMRVNKLPKGKEHMKKTVCESGEYFGQLKKDGYWYTYEKDVDGNSFLFSRDVSVKTGHLSEKSERVPHIMKFLDSKIPNGSQIVLEIYYPGKTSKDVGSIMNSDPEKAIARQQGTFGLLHAYMHDILSYDGTDFVVGTDHLTRYTMLEQLVKDLNLLSEPWMEFAKAQFTDLEKFIDDSMDNGEEGVVLKKKTGLFMPGKKPAWNWLKFKVEDAADVICVGYEPPTKEYTGDHLDTWKLWVTEDGVKVPISKAYANGWIGSVKIAVYNKSGELVDIGTVSGSTFSDEELEDISTNQDKYLNQPMAVEFMLAFDNALRHSKFIRWRDDLNLSDCTWEKIFE